MTTKSHAATVLVATIALLAGPIRCLGQPAPQPGSDLRSGTIEVPGGSLFYEVRGKGEALVLIHDGLVHRETWNEQFEPFSRGFRVVRYDRRGYGRSPAPTAPYSNVEDLRAVLDYLRIDEACLAGMSAGGRLAVDFTLAYPQRVKALVLVGAVVSGFGYSDHFLTRGGRLNAQDYASPESLRKFFAETDPYTIAPQNHEARATLRRLLEANPRSLDFSLDRFSLPPARPALPALDEVKVPTLIVVGDQDIPDVHAHAGALQAGIAGSQRVILANAGHLVPMEQPATFNELVMRFLKGRDLMRAIATGRIAEARVLLASLLDAYPASTLLSEREVNALGYRALAEGKFDEAIGVFQINAETFPNSWNAHDSLGETYAAKGEVARAIECYERSVALNPASESGKAALKELRARLAASPNGT